MASRKRRVKDMTRPEQQAAMASMTGGGAGTSVVGSRGLRTGLADVAASVSPGPAGKPKLRREPLEPEAPRAGLDLEGKIEYVGEPRHGNYPDTPMFQEDILFRKPTHKAMYAFKRLRPYRGSDHEKLVKFITLNAKLSKIYGIQVPKLVQGVMDGGPSGQSSYSPGTHTITLRGKYSVITYLHEFGHSRGMDEHDTVIWSVNLFRKIFPRLAENIDASGHFVSTRGGMGPDDPGNPARDVPAGSLAQRGGGMTSVPTGGLRSQIRSAVGDVDEN